MTRTGPDLKDINCSVLDIVEFQSAFDVSKRDDKVVLGRDLELKEKNSGLELKTQNSSICGKSSNPGV